MAFVSKEKKAKIAAALKIALKNSGIKYSLAVRHHSTIVMTIKSGPIDFIKNYLDQKDYSNMMLSPKELDTVTPHLTNINVNTYHYKTHFTGPASEILGKIIDCLNLDNYDRSDSQSDYYDVGHYVDVNIGRWDKPYVLTELVE
jgi:hypothetical protein